MRVRLHDLEAQDDKENEGSERAHPAISQARRIRLVLELDLLSEFLDELGLLSHLLFLLCIGAFWQGFGGLLCDGSWRCSFAGRGFCGT